ncbi:MAG TPA: hypothetical protein VEX68_27215 [Bryobacteraceae bacterium]|nr:hypothetical protein [Bryobacteraceae bacterium]
MFSFRRNRRPEIPLAEPALPYPLTPRPPIAILSPYFPHSTIALKDAKTVAAPMSTIRSIDRQIWSPDFPVVVFSSVNEGLATDADRDYIWRNFGVPVFEYFLSEEGKIVARECEAHEGLHLDHPVPGLVTEEQCPCGRPGNRLLRLTAEDQQVNAII